MNCKVYIVSCDNDKVFDKLISNIEITTPGIVSKNYRKIKFGILQAKVATYFSKYSDKDVQAVNMIADRLDKYNGCVFNSVLQLIDDYDYRGVFLFIRVTDLYEMNRLKRKIKRPNYKTIRIDSTSVISKLLKTKYHKYRFDSRIQYVNDNLLKSQAKQFVRQHLGTLNQIRN